MNKRKFIVWAIGALLLAFVAWKLHTSHFDWGAFWHACRSADLRLVLLATIVININPVIRALRWWIFLKPSLPHGQRPPWTSLIGPQFIGFAGLALLGRIGELFRPYLVSRRVNLSFSSQVAVVAVERIFDLAAFGILFSGNLLLSPDLMTMPYHERFHLFGYAIAGVTVFLCLFVLLVRLAGETLARVSRSIVARFSASAGDSVAAKILEFRDGLNTIASVGDFLSIFALSMLTWISIAAAYVITLHAFPPPVHSLGAPHALFLMGFSVVGGLVQLPGIGGGPQIMMALVLNRLMGIPPELATSAGVILWCVTSMTVILPGLVYAHVEGVTLRGLARSSEGEPA